MPSVKITEYDRIAKDINGFVLSPTVTANRVSREEKEELWWESKFVFGENKWRISEDAATVLHPSNHFEVRKTKGSWNVCSMFVVLCCHWILAFEVLLGLSSWNIQVNCLAQFWRVYSQFVCSYIGKGIVLGLKISTLVTCCIVLTCLFGVSLNMKTLFVKLTT